MLRKFYGPWTLSTLLRMTVGLPSKFYLWFHCLQPILIANFVLILTELCLVDLISSSNLDSSNSKARVAFSLIFNQLRRIRGCRFSSSSCSKKMWFNLHLYGNHHLVKVGRRMNLPSSCWNCHTEYTHSYHNLLDSSSGTREQMAMHRS